MAVTVTNPIAGPFTPNGATTAFPFSFKIMTTSEIRVAQGPAEAPLTISPSQYSVTLAVDGEGGTVSFLTAPASGGGSIYLESDPIYTNEAEFTAGGPFSAQALNPLFDKDAIKDISLKQRLLTETAARLVADDAQSALITALEAIAKGDPGGNTMAIGLFVGASGLSVPAGTDMVRTSGYDTNGMGAAYYVYDAAVDAAYVTAHPRSSFITTNARGFRLDVSAGINIQQVGGKPDTTGLVGSFFNGTDDYLAFVEAKLLLGNGGTLRIPQGSGAYRSSQKVTFTEGINIEGDGWHQNPGQVGATTYIGVQRYPGSVICFDQNVAGFEFIPFTDNNADATALEFQSAAYSNMSKLMLMGGGGTSTSAHGLFSRATIYVDYVRIIEFAGNGVHLLAWPYGALPWGSTDFATFRTVHVDHCGCHGWYMQGDDANVMTFIGCSSIENGGCGVLDISFLGNTYIAFHCAINNQSHPLNNGAAYSAGQRTFVTSMAGTPGKTESGWSGLSDQYAGSYITTSASGSHVFLGCYAEGPAQGWRHSVCAPSIILGGALAPAEQVAPIQAGLFPAIVLNTENLHNVDNFTTGPGPGFLFNHGITSDNVQSTGFITVRGLGPTADFNLYSATGLAEGLRIFAGAGFAAYHSPQHVFANAGGITKFTVNEANIDLPGGSDYRINGVKVVGSRIAPSAGAATDLATAITLVNELATVLATHGLRA